MGEQLALLFRDYLRCHPETAAEYAAAKHRLAERYRYERASYVAAKEPIIWDILRAGSEWSQAVGWELSDSDA